MVRVLELTTGLVLLTWSLWAFFNPRRDFELGRKIGFLGVRNREQLELNSFGVLRNRIGYAFLALVAAVLIVDSVYLLT